MDRDKANDIAGQFTRPGKARPSVFKRSQSANSLREARFLFVCSLVLAAAFALMAGFNLVLGYGGQPSVAVLVVVAVAVGVTWQRYRRLRRAAGA